MKNFLTTVLLIFLAGTVATANSGNLVGIAPYCEGNISWYNKASPVTPIKIEVKFTKPQKWYINTLNILTSDTELIWEKYKKKFSGFIHVYFRDDKKCIFPAKIRQSGDWKDHIILADGNIQQSLNVKLNKGNILGVVSFKLLIPSTREGKNEVIFTTLLRELGYLAPRTRFVDVELMGNSYEALFQENTRKELLESSNLREGPLLEGNEGFMWGSEKNNIKANDKLIFSRLMNSKWASRGATSFQISNIAVSRLNSAFLDYLILRHATVKHSKYNHVYLDNSKLSNKNKQHTQYLDLYDSIVTAAGGTHALLPHNRKFYYDPIYQKFLPIYYDGDISFNAIIEAGGVPFGVSPSAVSGAAYAMQKLNSLNLDEFSMKVKEQGVLIKKEELKDIIQIIVTNLNYLQTYKIEDVEIIRNLKDYIRSVSNDFPNVRYAYFDDLKNSLFICPELLESCEFRSLTTADYAKLLAGKLKIDDWASVLYLGVVNIDSLDGYEQANLRSSTFKTSDLPGNVKLTTTLGMKVKYDSDANILVIDQNVPDGRALLSGGKINGMNIIFRGINSLNVNKNKQRFDERLLTGCLTILDSELINTSVQVSSTLCEDGLNLFRVKGSIKELVISDSISDALDMDFSVVNIGTTKINNAGNDCVDVSGGTYKMSKITATNCQDKGVSIGEQSIFSSSDVSISNSNTGLSVKDTSLAKIKTLTAQGSNTCLAASRKKQEFMGAVAEIGQIKCANGDVISDPGSQIIVGTTH